MLTHVVTTISAASAPVSVCARSAAQMMPRMDFWEWQCSSVSQVQERQGGRSCTGSCKAVLLGTYTQATAATAGQKPAAPAAGQETTAACKETAAASQEAAAPQATAATPTKGARHLLCCPTLAASPK